MLISHIYKYSENNPETNKIYIFACLIHLIVTLICIGTRQSNVQLCMLYLFNCNAYMYKNRILCNKLFVIYQLLYVKIENKYLSIYVSASHAFWQLTTFNYHHHPNLLGTFRSMDNTCIINLAYSLNC